MTDPTATAERPIRMCLACKQVDDHPMHAIAVAPGTPGTVLSADEIVAAIPEGLPAAQIAQVLIRAVNPRAIERHKDCCAAAGCIVCQAEEAVTGGVRGQDLIDALAGGALADHVAPEVTSNKEFGLDG